MDMHGDDRVIQRVLAGRREDFGLLVTKYLPTVQAVAIARVGHWADAEDVAQETFLRALQSLDRLRERAKFGPWAVGIARNVSSQLLRSRSRESEAVTEGAPRGEAVEPDVESRELQAVIRQKIAELDEAHREVVLLFYFAGKSLREAAVLLDISHEAARKRLQRAREALGERLLSDLMSGDAGQKEFAKRASAITLAALAANVPWGGAANAAHTATLSFAGTAGAIKIVGAVVALGALATFVLYGTRQFAPSPSGTVPAPQPVSASVSISAEEEAAPIATLEEPSPGPQASPSAGAIATVATGPTITGVVLDSTERPVPGAEVELNDSQLRRSLPLERRNEVVRPRVVADNRGRFEFTYDRTSSELYLSAEKEGFVRFPAEKFILSESGLVDVVLTLYRPASIAGRVVDDRGRPVAGKAVSQFFYHPDERLDVSSTVTDAQGLFRLGDLLPGKHAVTVIPEEQVTMGFEDAMVELEPGQHLADLDIHYPGEDYIVAGRVTDESGKPIKGASVQVVGGHGMDSPSGSTDEEGRYRIVRIPEGRYMMAASATNYSSQSLSMAMAVAGDENYDIVLNAIDRYDFRGRVVADETGEPLMDFEMVGGYGNYESLADTMGGSIPLPTTPDENGVFVWPNVERRESYAIVKAPGREVKLVNFDFTGEIPDLVTIRLKKSGGVRGLVLTPDGEPVADAYVLLKPFPRMLASMDSRQLLAQWLGENEVAHSDADGAFEVTSLPSEFEVITAIHLDYGYASLAVEPDRIDPDGLSFVLRKGGIIEGTVTDGGEPARSAWILVTGVDEFGEPFYGGNTDDSGRYRIEWLSPGNHLLVARLRPQGGGIRSIMAGRTRTGEAVVAESEIANLDFEFMPAEAAIRGHVTLEGAPAQSGRLVLVVETATGTVESMDHLLNTDAYRFDSVPPGPATLYVLAGTTAQMEWRSQTIELTVEEGIEYDFDIDITGGKPLDGTITGLAEDEEYVQVILLEGALDDDLFTTMDFPVTRLQRGSTLARTDGTFRIEGVQPGTYTAWIHAMTPVGNGGYRPSRQITMVVEVPEGDKEVPPLRIAF